MRSWEGLQLYHFNLFEMKTKTEMGGQYGEKKNIRRINRDSFMWTDLPVATNVLRVRK